MGKDRDAQRGGRVLCHICARFPARKRTATAEELEFRGAGRRLAGREGAGGCALALLPAPLFVKWGARDETIAAT